MADRNHTRGNIGNHLRNKEGVKAWGTIAFVEVEVEDGVGFAIQGARKNEGIRAFAAGGQGAAAAAGGGRLPLTGAGMTAVVLAMAAIVMGGGFILVRRRMAD